MLWLWWMMSELLKHFEAFPLLDSKFRNKAFILAVLSAWNTLQNDSRLSDHITQIGFAPFYGNLDQKEYLINYAVTCASDKIGSYSRGKKYLLQFLRWVGKMLNSVISC